VHVFEDGMYAVAGTVSSYVASFIVGLLTITVVALLSSAPYCMPMLAVMMLSYGADEP